jgi:hypothetical protein
MTAWTIRLALACLAGALARGSGTQAQSRRWRLHRAVWTAGCVLAWLHVAAALHYFHGWSYAHAAAETSRRTAEAIGRSWGGEIWFNFAFIGLWAADAAWRWLRPDWSERLAVPSAAIHVYLFFIAFNATVVFESGATRAAGIAGSAAVVLAVAYRAFQGDPPDGPIPAEAKR